MTPEPEAQWQKYIDVILQVGLNLRRGQRLLIGGGLGGGVDLSLQPFIRLLVEAAYDYGASFVDVLWGDDRLDHLVRLQKAPADSLKRYTGWRGAARHEFFGSADAVLTVSSTDPDLLAGIDPRRVADLSEGVRENFKPAMVLQSRNAGNWCVVAAPAAGWAARVLPELPAAERVSRLWQLIFSTCRVDQADPIASWRKHASTLNARARYLTDKQYAFLNYAGPGTHLKVGLPPGHIWDGGSMVAENGVTFIPNLPTEEVFTLPDRAAVDGEVTSSLPFSPGGNTIEGMKLTFSEGKVVRFSARTGEGILRELLKSDEGSSRLGEVALVPHSSPISQSGVTFHSTLFDENAASHLALGDAYRFTLRDANDITAEEFAARGGNSSSIHNDFMIGSGALDVDGTLPSGQSEPVMRAGEWAFDV